MSTAAAGVCTVCCVCLPAAAVVLGLAAIGLSSISHTAAYLHCSRMLLVTLYVSLAMSCALACLPSGPGVADQSAAAITYWCWGTRS